MIPKKRPTPERISIHPEFQSKLLPTSSSQERSETKDRGTRFRQKPGELQIARVFNSNEFSPNFDLSQGKATGSTAAIALSSKNLQIQSNLAFEDDSPAANRSMRGRPIRIETPRRGNSRRQIANDQNKSNGVKRKMVRKRVPLNLISSSRML